MQIVDDNYSGEICEKCDKFINLKNLQTGEIIKEDLCKCETQCNETGTK